MTGFTRGQRWISETEPELGLGKVLRVEGRQVHIHFPSADVVRRYAVASAPIRRVRFRTGDRVRGQGEKSFIVRAVYEKDGLLVYQGDGGHLPETELSDLIGFSTPADRLAAGQVDPSADFELRYETLRMQHHNRRSPVRGFTGGRVHLIAHQFYIAHEVATRQSPRVLLSDETGLGKTIEACLILHRLVISGRIGRVLVLLPESLVHQWLVELLRRFNLLFKIYDETLCSSIEQADPGANPFMDDQLIICSLGFVTDHPTRAGQILSVPWDMLVVDEAHHIRENSPAYELLAALAERIPRLLLLTATPEQLGLGSHFARLRLLDPARYFDLERFRQEAENFHKIAAVAGRLLDDKPLRAQDRQLLQNLSGLRSEYSAVLDSGPADDPERRRLMDDLIDRHGIGRVVFRNTRKTIKGFPRRRAHLIPLPYDGDPRLHLSQLAETFEKETENRAYGRPCDFASDPRISWLARLLRELKREKVLLICHSVEKTLAIDRALAKQIRVKTALFHEALSLIQRDRNAAWFAEKGGARIMICSEIGSEGRNFQFARHLVLFDLPLDPELLEQRIGRLDRIGQKSTVHIHVPYIQGSVQEVLARWYHEGLNALEKNLPGGHQVMEEFGGQVRELALCFYRSDPEKSAAMDRLITETVAFRKDLAKKLRKGRDRLLELCAFRPDRAGEILRQVRDRDQSRVLDQFMLKIFDHYGIDVESLDLRTFQLRPNLRFEESFPGVKDEEMTVTFERNAAITNEHLRFLTWDHPMVTGAMEMLLGSDRGNCAVALWPDPGEPSILLEVIFVLECVSPIHLHVDRFLPATPVRLVIDHLLEDRDTDFPAEPLAGHLEDAPPDLFLGDSRLIQDLFEQMMAAAQKMAGEKADAIIAKGRMRMREGLDREIRRLQDLARVNPNIRQEEINLAVRERDTLEQNISAARLRLDALRLIWKGSRPGS